MAGRLRGRLTYSVAGGATAWRFQLMGWLGAGARRPRLEATPCRSPPPASGRKIGHSTTGSGLWRGLGDVSVTARPDG